MSGSWLMAFVVGNAAIIALLFFAVMRWKNALHEGPGLLSGESRKSLISLHQLTCEVTRRVEHNVERLDGVVRQLAAVAAESLSVTAESLHTLRSGVNEQSEFAGFLRKSSVGFQRHRANLAAELEPAGSAFGRTAELPSPAQLPSQGHEPHVGAALAPVESGGWPAGATERRGANRKPVTFTLLVLPLDAGLQPDGPLLAAIARDISTDGMSFSHDVPLDSPYLALRMTPPNMEELCVVMDRKYTSRIGPCFVTGGAFVRRLNAGIAIREMFENTACVPASARDG